MQDCTFVPLVQREADLINSLVDAFFTRRRRYKDCGWKDALQGCVTAELGWAGLGRRELDWSKHRMHKVV